MKRQLYRYGYIITERLINAIEYYGYSYKDYEERIQEIESKISILKNLENF